MTKEQVLARYTPGEQSLYGVVPGEIKNLAEVKDFQKHCGKQELNETVASSLNTWMAQKRQNALA